MNEVIDDTMNEVTEDALYKGFSCPIEPLDESLLVLVATQYARSVIELFLDRFGASLPDSSIGVTALMKKVIYTTSEFEIIWSAALGRCYKAVKSGDTSLSTQVAAEFLLHSAAKGAIGDWEVRMAKPCVLLWDCWLLPACDYLAVRSTGDTALIQTKTEGSERQIIFHRDAGNGLRWYSDQAERLPSISTNRAAVVLLPQRAINPENHNDCGFPLVSEITTRIYESFVQAFAHLKEYAPSYYTWVARILRWIVVVRAGAQKYPRSGSQEGLCGMVCISDSQDILSLGEMLVHETTHNYCYLAGRLGFLTDRLNEQLYYSPFLNAMRPLEAILVTYHAYANVYFYYRSYLNTAPDSRDICVERMKVILEDLKAIEGPIVKNCDQLTPIGAALTEPLIRELRDEY